MNTIGIPRPIVSRDRLRPHDIALAVDPRGRLIIDGCRITDLVKEFGAPLWVMSESMIRANVATIHSAFSGSRCHTKVVYASKANPAPQVLALVADAGAMVDVASEGHAELARRSGTAPDRLVVNGNCKTTEYLNWAINSGVAAINVDSVAELNRIIDLRRGEDRVRIALRVATDLARHRDDAGMHTSEMETKFGMSTPDVIEAMQRIAAVPQIELLGLHHHLGFTAFDLDYNAALDLKRRRRVIEQLVDIAVIARAITGTPVGVFNLGGGFRIATDTGYGPRAITSMPDLEDSVASTANYLAELLERHGLASPEVWIEPGGFITSSAGVFIARVGLRKTVETGSNARNWAFLDKTSGYHFVRRLMVDVHHPTLAANRMDDPCTVLIEVAGATCAPDTVSQPSLLPELERGDLVALLDQGAYCDSVATEYCSFPIPASVMASKGTAKPIRRRRNEIDLADDFADLAMGVTGGVM